MMRVSNDLLIRFLLLMPCLVVVIVMGLHLATVDRDGGLALTFTAAGFCLGFAVAGLNIAQMIGREP